MRKPCLWLVVTGALALSAALPEARAAEAAPVPQAPAAKPSPALSPEALAARIDEMIAARWKEQGVTPSPAADDSEFLRRLYLDLGGRIPHIQEVRQFLDDPSPDKSRRVVDRMLESPYYVSHFTNVWRALMVPQSNNQFAQAFGSQLDGWLRKRIRENARYDQMVREVLTTPVALRQQRPAAGMPEPTPLAFYQANELKPENLAAATSRLFLGVKLECAQCHNHPFARWSRQQFWEYAAFFSPIQTPRGQANVFAGAQESANKREIAIPGTDKVVQAKFLDGVLPAWKDDAGTRETLAQWVTSPDNPFFARAIANRLWAHFFGIGIIEPVDEESDENPPSHPELLNELARQLVLHGFDLKYLMRAITYSKTYKLSSVAYSSDAPEARLFARMSLKGLTAEQMYDSIVVATGYREPGNPAAQRSAFNPGGMRGEFINRFTNHSDKRTEYQTSILQALALMNGKFVADATSLDRSETLAGVLDAPFLDTPGKLETLYLAALGRKPRAEELSRLVPYVERGGPSGNRNKALADVFWALLNSSEFILNH
jgi:hypothetical protein